MSTEFTKLTRQQLEEAAKSIAKTRIIGSLFVGNIGEQKVKWTDDGGIEVLTDYVRGELPPAMPPPKRRTKGRWP